MTVIKAKNFDEAKGEIRKNKGKEIIFSSDNDELNRKILEKEEINILLLNQAGRKDKLKQKNSGLNQILAKIAKSKDVIIGINFDEIISSKDKQRAKILARIAQNIKLCGKNRIKMKFISEKNERDLYDLRALGLILGMPTNMTKVL